MVLLKKTGVRSLMWDVFFVDMMLVYFDKYRLENLSICVEFLKEGVLICSVFFVIIYQQEQGGYKQVVVNKYKCGAYIWFFFVVLLYINN